MHTEKILGVILGSVFLCVLTLIDTHACLVPSSQECWKYRTQARHNTVFNHEKLVPGFSAEVHHKKHSGFWDDHKSHPGYSAELVRARFAALNSKTGVSVPERLAKSSAVS